MSPSTKMTSNNLQCKNTSCFVIMYVHLEVGTGASYFWIRYKGTIPGVNVPLRCFSVSRKDP